MHLIHPGPDEAMLCLRAVHSVVARAEGIPSAVRAMMTAAQRLVLHTDADLDALAPITPAELAAGISTPGLGESGRPGDAAGRHRRRRARPCLRRAGRGFCYRFGRHCARP